MALLYQFPEAAADSSDAAASVQLCAGTGETLEQALFTAEEHLPQRPSYRLCEYLFLNTGSLRGELSACEPLFCERCADNRETFRCFVLASKYICKITSFTDRFSHGQNDHTYFFLLK